jgi:hypothetical protein
MKHDHFTPTTAAVLDTGMVNYQDIDASDDKTTYSTITFRQIAALVQQPKVVKRLLKSTKKDATRSDHIKATATRHAGWFTPSTLLSRNNDKQRDEGEFIGCALDFDEVPDYFAHLAGVQKVLGKMLFMSYSSARSSSENQKMRVVIPFNAPVDGKTFAAIVACLHADLEAAGLNPDKCMLECNRVYFLPFKGDLYRWNISNGNETWGHVGHDDEPANVCVDDLEIDPAMLFDPLEMYSSRIEPKELDQAQIDKQINKAVAAERRRLKKEQRPIDLTKPIDWFNQYHDIEQLLLAAGYDQQGAKFRHPQSESGSFSGIVFENDGATPRYFTLSTKDPLKDDQGRSHDAFSVFTVLEHAGDQQAALEAVKLERQNTTNKLAGTPVQTIEVTPEDVEKGRDYEVAGQFEEPQFKPAPITPFRGVMTDLTEAIVASSFKTQPTLAAAGALAGMAAGVPRQYCIQGGTRIGLYTLLLSPTGSGKDHIEQSAKEIAQAMNCGIVGGGLSSGQGLEDQIKENAQGTNMLHMTECAHVLECYHSSNRNQQAHITFLFSVLLSLYSTRGSYVTRSLAGKASATIERPAFNFLAASTPEKLGSVVTRENIIEGLLNRMLFVMGESKPPDNYSFGDLVMPESFEAAKFALTPASAADVLIGLTPEAEAMKRRIGKAYSDQGDDELQRALFGRSYEKVMKVAATLAAWDCMDTPTISPEHLEYARYYVDACNSNLVEFIGRFMFGSETQRNADIVFKAVISVLNRRTAGSMRANEWAAIRNGFAPRSVVLRMSNLEVKLFDAALDHLRALDKLEAAMVKVNGGSKPMAVIKLA